MSKRPIHGMLICATSLSLSCNTTLPPHLAQSKAGIRVREILPTEIDSTVSLPENAAEICGGWRLTAAQAERLFVLSKEIDSRTYHHTYDTAPCRIDGKVEVNGVVWQFTINGAAKAQWTKGQRVRFLGCEAKACTPLVMDPFVDPSKL